jgi:hypothetical protein
MLYISPLACLSNSSCFSLSFTNFFCIYLSFKFLHSLPFYKFLCFFLCNFLQSFNCTFLIHVVKHIVNTKHEHAMKKPQTLKRNLVATLASRFFFQGSLPFLY